MKTSLTARLAALVASIFVTFATVHVIANYALPEAPATELAQAAPRG
jgi:hypothetical protein